jgi:hypothetical protein
MRGRRDPQPSLFYAIDVEARIRPARADVAAGRGWLTGNVESVVFAGRGAVFGDPTERVDVQGSEVVDPAAAVGVIRVTELAASRRAPEVSSKAPPPPAPSMAGWPRW